MNDYAPLFEISTIDGRFVMEWKGKKGTEFMEKHFAVAVGVANDKGFSLEELGELTRDVSAAIGESFLKISEGDGIKNPKGLLGSEMCPYKTP